MAAAPAEPSLGAQLAISLQRNRELTIKLYTMRNEAAPDDAACAPAPAEAPLKIRRPHAWPSTLSAALTCARLSVDPAIPERPRAAPLRASEGACRLRSCPASLAPRRSDHSCMPEPAADARPKAWEVYAGMPGIDSLYTGLSKRTPNGGFFSS